LPAILKDAMKLRSPEAQTWKILIVVLIAQGSFVLWSIVDNPHGFLKYLGFVDSKDGIAGAWLLAALVTIAYVWSAASISAVRHYLFRPDALKALAVVVAIAAAILEEVVFRKWVMDFLRDRGHSAVLQVLASGLAFGMVHMVWCLSNLAAGINAILSTTILGMALALVYLLGERSLAPCIAAHFFITSLIEPGLIIAALTEKIGYFSKHPR
jgi:membrane protease YdiL (CAAX protease family)